MKYSITEYSNCTSTVNPDRTRLVLRARRKVIDIYTHGQSVQYKIASSDTWHGLRVTPPPLNGASRKSTMACALRTGREVKEIEDDIDTSVEDLQLVEPTAFDYGILWVAILSLFPFVAGRTTSWGRIVWMSCGSLAVVTTTHLLDSRLPLADIVTESLLLVVMLLRLSPSWMVFVAAFVCMKGVSSPIRYLLAQPHVQRQEVSVPKQKAWTV